MGDRTAATATRDARSRCRIGERPSKPTGTAAGYAANLSSLRTAVERPASSWLAIFTRPPATSFPNRGAVATLLRTSNSRTWPVLADAVRTPPSHDSRHPQRLTFSIRRSGSAPRTAAKLDFPDGPFFAPPTASTSETRPGGHRSNRRNCLEHDPVSSSLCDALERK